MAFSTEIALQYLKSAWQAERLAHAYIVSGLDAAGRLNFVQALVRLIQRSPGADWQALSKLGVQRVEPESKSRKIAVKQIRDLERHLNLRQAPGLWKVGIIVDADRMGEEAMNAFLKTLEEPPSFTLLLLLTSQPAQLLPTVCSRCLRLDLVDPEAEAAIERNEDEQVVIDLLAQHFSRQTSVSRAMTFQRAYSSLLSSIKERITAEQEKVQKSEASCYKDTTDAAKWIKEREAYYEAQISSQYLQRRESLLVLLMQWLGDMISVKEGVKRLHFPDAEALLRQASARYSMADLLQRFACLEDLHRAYATNVNEALATELSFVGAFS